MDEPSEIHQLSASGPSWSCNRMPNSTCAGW